MQLGELVQDVTTLMESVGAPIDAYLIRSVVREDMQEQCPTQDLVFLLTSEHGLRALAEKLGAEVLAKTACLDLLDLFRLPLKHPIGGLPKVFYTESGVEDKYYLKAYAPATAPVEAPVTR